MESKKEKMVHMHTLRCYFRQLTRKNFKVWHHNDFYATIELPAFFSFVIRSRAKFTKTGSRNIFRRNIHLCQEMDDCKCTGSG